MKVSDNDSSKLQKSNFIFKHWSCWLAYVIKISGHKCQLLLASSKLFFNMNSNYGYSNWEISMNTWSKRKTHSTHTHAYKLHKLKFALDLWLDSRIYNLTLWFIESEKTILSSLKLYLSIGLFSLQLTIDFTKILACSNNLKYL